MCTLGCRMQGVERVLKEFYTEALLLTFEAHENKREREGDYRTHPNSRATRLLGSASPSRGRSRYIKIKMYRLIDLRARSFLRGDYQTTWGWAKVFLKALVE